MKKAIALIAAAVITFSSSVAVFAQTVTKDFTYNVVVNGEKVSNSANDGINVDGSTMFTAESFAGFPNAGLTVQNVSASGQAFEYEGKSYYSVRDVANSNGLSVFWDSATSTALIVNTDKYEKVRDLIAASTEQSENAKRVELEMLANVAVNALIMGETQSFAMPLSGDMKMDIEAPYLEMDLKMSVMGQETTSKMYDDGKFTYTFEPSSGIWLKMESTLGQSLGMVDQFKAINPSVGALADDLSYAGLKLTETADGTILEGDMYVSETFKSMDLDGFINEMIASMGDTGVTFNYELPKVVYVKYVFDNDKNVTAMDMKLDLGIDITAEGQSNTVNISMDLKIPKMIIDGEFSTTVPEEVTNNAIDMEEYLNQAMEAAAAEAEADSAAAE